MGTPLCSQPPMGAHPMPEYQVTTHSEGSTVQTFTEGDLINVIRWLASEKTALKTLAAALKPELDALYRQERSAGF